jgi:hypothetical protein
MGISRADLAAGPTPTGHVHPSQTSRIHFARKGHQLAAPDPHSTEYAEFRDDALLLILMAEISEARVHNHDCVIPKSPRFLQRGEGSRVQHPGARWHAHPSQTATMPTC